MWRRQLLSITHLWKQKDSLVSPLEDKVEKFVAKELLAIKRRVVRRGEKKICLDAFYLEKELACNPINSINTRDSALDAAAVGRLEIGREVSSLAMQGPLKQCAITKHMGLKHRQSCQFTTLNLHKKKKKKKKKNHVHMNKKFKKKKKKSKHTTGSISHRIMHF
ncbi:hypothetical protein llap_10401 [Limosa lapponica baueri]|uniref:Uncharacterized protein n=1 Tax=Limosa lapponica baueri TaxID=1758121 RepID=A0A2I0TZN7_LIMLA|nr:hypothetical protein llap_10401 [Limosa lapponica baueri]